MVDLAPLFALGESLARQAITTAGTRVRFETRTTKTESVDVGPVTTAVTLAEVPAIVIPAGNVNAAPELLPGIEVRPGDWRVVCTTDLTPPEVGAWVVVTESRDPHLPGRDAKVLGHTVTSVGAVVDVYARPVPS